MNWDLKFYSVLNISVIMVIFSAAVEDVVSIGGCQVGSLADLSLETALVCALHFINT